MSNDFTTAVPADPEILARVPFGRNRALALIGGTLFSFALQLTAPRVARASHGAIPYPCFGYGVCHCCSGFTCCESGCFNPGNVGCPTAGQCWITCDCQNNYQCCDWGGSSTGGNCICSGIVSLCTGPC